MSPPVAQLPQWLRATLRLRELMLDGELRGGERLSEIPLSEQLGVSRTPLRLALARLEHEGLVEAAPGGGFVVRAFTREEAADAIELRGVLEGTAARLAAERLDDPNELEALHGCVAQLDAIVRRDRPAAAVFERYVELNERFHTIVLGLARSRPLEAAYAGVLALPFASPRDPRGDRAPRRRPGRGAGARARPPRARPPRRGARHAAGPRAASRWRPHQDQWKPLGTSAPAASGTHATSQATCA
jgi:DNA-binding GntR family transcriptional regulator